MTFGDRVKAARKALQLSQVALADAVGVHQSVISDLERGVTIDPSAATLLRLATELRTSPEGLLFGQAAYAVAQSQPEAETDSEDAEDQAAILRLYLRLSPAHRRALLSIARTLRQSERESSPGNTQDKPSAA